MRLGRWSVDSVRMPGCRGVAPPPGRSARSVLVDRGVSGWAYSPLVGQTSGKPASRRLPRRSAIPYPARGRFEPWTRLSPPCFPSHVTPHNAVHDGWVVETGPEGDHHAGRDGAHIRSWDRGHLARSLRACPAPIALRARSAIAAPGQRLTIITPALQMRSPPAAPDAGVAML